MSEDGIHIVRLESSDYGTEARVRVTLGGRTVELTYCSDGDGRSIDLWELGPAENEYRYGHLLVAGALDAVGTQSNTAREPKSGD